MRRMRRSSEAEMVALFLRTELPAARHRDDLRALLERGGLSERVITAPDLGDDAENQARLRLLTWHRGYGTRTELFDGFPAARDGAGEAGIVLLGRTEPEFGGSAWAHVCHGHLGGRPPAPDLEAERRLAAQLAAAAADGLLAAAHDLSDGGLAIALAESCLRGGTGCTVRLPGDPFTPLFSESPARAVVAVPPGAEAAFGRLARAHDVPATVIGTVTGDSLTVIGCFSIPLAELAAVHAQALPALFGPVVPGSVSGPVESGPVVSGPVVSG